jgi:mannose-6-phosphate isomerase-like protein (cupin superfamily)
MMKRAPMVLPIRTGRSYAMPGMTAVFKADGPETSDAYCVSEWWLEAGADGPGPHFHEENDEIFVILSGTISLLVGEEWIDAQAGTTVIVPAGVMHDFRNRSAAEAGLLNVFIPGGFEKQMPAILEWYDKN